MSDDHIPDAVWIGDPDPDCPECGGTGDGNLVYEAATDTWDAAECPCTYRLDRPSW
jgi:hypothetical protein